MKLSRLIKNCDVAVSKRIQNLEIKGIAYNSKNVKNNYIFIAIKGFNTDGHNFIDEAIKNGASVIAVEPHFDISQTKDIAIIKTKNNRIFLSKLASNFYNHPSLKLDLIGITGTNGKTTTAYLIEHILKSASLRTGLIGTINYKILNRKYTAETTTPESLDFQKLLYKMTKSSIRYVPAEISSHSLKLHRVDDLHFKIGIFTNLTEDHFDFHKNFRDYFESKSRLFELLQDSKKKNKLAIINIDDKWGKLLYKRFKNRIKIYTYGINEDADFKAEDLNLSTHGSCFRIKHKNKNFPVKTSLIGKFNIYNILAAFIAVRFFNISADSIISSINKFKGPAGRMEIIKSNNFCIAIDYAHTDDALKNVLSSIKEISTGRIITVFGCGGDRDRKKRPKMGYIAAKLSDIVIVTSDNPRTEDPDRIIDEIEKGIFKLRTNNYYRISDRKKAIASAISMAKPDDFILIAGKGHENYQIIGTKKFPFNDKETVLNILKAGGKDA